MKLQNILEIPVYPLFISSYPVLALLSTNYDQQNLALIVRPLIILVGLTLLLMFILSRIFKDVHRAAFATALISILFSSYGHVYLLVQKRWALDHATLILLPIWLGLIVLVFWAASRPKFNAKMLALPLNVATLFLLFFPISTLGKFYTKQNTPLPINEEASLPAIQSPLPKDAPDIYYIILDSYGRSDLLADRYNHDNSKFIAALKDRGFYVADCSRSNYPRTEESLASSLNMDYLQPLNDIFTSKDSTSRVPLWKLLKNNRVFSMLEQAGYETYAFSTGFYWSELDNADRFISPSFFTPSPMEFETLIMQTTLLRVAGDLGWLDFDAFPAIQYRLRTRLVLDSLGEIASQSGRPKFVFAHIISPHPPFVYGPGGKEIDPGQFIPPDGIYTLDTYSKGYDLQATFIEEEILRTVSEIQANSKTPPVIIIQGDHAPWIAPKLRAFDILNAYYLPQPSEELYAGISPVNTFRLVLNEYLGTQYPLLIDQSYASPIPKIYNFSQVNSACKN